MTEEALHRSVADFLRVALPPGAFATAVQAGGSSKAINAKRKGLGVVAGVPDFLIWFEGDCIGIELKAADGRVSPAQAATFAQLRAAGVPVEICRSLDEVQVALNIFGIPLKARAA